MITSLVCAVLNLLFWLPYCLAQPQAKVKGIKSSASFVVVIDIWSAEEGRDLTIPGYRSISALSEIFFVAPHDFAKLFTN